MLNPKQVFKMNQIKPKTSNSYLKTNNICLINLIVIDDGMIHIGLKKELILVGF